MSNATQNSATSQATRLIGLFGYPVEHSLSPAMQNAAFEASGLPLRYVLMPASADEFPSLLYESIERGFVGWNVTVPHKERMLDYLDEMSDEVRAIGACNTVRVVDGKLVGYNTDPIGFMGGLEESGRIEPGGRAILLGAGGAARAVTWALPQAGHDVLLLSRRPEQAAEVARSLQPNAPALIEYGCLDRPTLEAAMPNAALLVNCTPAGQWPHAEESPLPGGATMLEHLLVYDLVYNPRPTRLLKEADEVGCRTQDGLAMLVNQGAAAFELWTGCVAPLDVMKDVMRNA